MKRLSSSRSDQLFAGVFSQGGAAAQVGDDAWLRAMLEFEAALARACARERLIPEAHAATIAAACEPERFDVAAIGRDVALGGNPAIPLVLALRHAVGEPAAPSVHHGATSQDVIDTAAMLVASRALQVILADASAAADAAAGLAQVHRVTPQIGRTLLQQALPRSFGLKAAGWMAGIDTARVALAACELPLQLGGAVGTLGAYRERADAVTRAMAGDLGLALPPLPWHGNRVAPARLAGALAVLAGSLAKVARDVVLLAQDEIAEVHEATAPGVGGSSAMAHKRNPIAAVSTLACAERVPDLVATMHRAMSGEHERAAGAWHTEWETLSDALRLTGSAAHWTRQLLEGLQVDALRMRATAQDAAARHQLSLEGGVAAAARLVDKALAARPTG